MADFFRRPSPNHGMVDPMQPPKVDMPPAKIYKEVPLPKTDVSKEKRKMENCPLRKV